MRSSLAGIAFLSCGTLATAGEAPIIKTLDFYQHTEAGSAPVCGLAFAYTLKDSRDPERAIGVRGMLNHIRQSGRGTVVFLTFLPMDLHGGSDKAPSPFIPTSVNFSGARSGVNLPFKPFPCDPKAPPKVCMYLTGADLLQFEKDMVDGGISVAFNRVKGGPDYRIVIDQAASPEGGDAAAHKAKLNTHLRCVVQIFKGEQRDSGRMEDFGTRPKPQ